MEIISCGKSTKLQKFPELPKICVDYKHPNDLNSDIKIHTKNSFILTHKNWGFELIRVLRSSDTIQKIECIKKLRLDNLYCSALSKTSKDFAALGLSNDSIKIFNLKSNSWDKKLKVESNNSPIFLDYSNCDEYLGVVLESGLINIYGLKTSVKTDTIKLDSNSSLAKFHPTKRFQLGVASLGGIVSVYDIQSKKIHFQNDCHTAPCSDVFMPHDVPDRLFSVGYDSIVNIFDTRKKTFGLRIESNSPLSSISATSCGTLFAVGSLKGEIAGYDIRNLKNPITTAKPHENGIHRLILYSTDNNSSVADTSELTFNRRETLPSKDNTSFAEENDQNVSNISFMDDIMDLHRRARYSDIPSNFISRVSLTGNEERDNRLSSDFTTKKTVEMFHNLSLNMNVSEELEQENSETKLDDSCVNKERLLNRAKMNHSDVRESGNVISLENIEEEPSTCVIDQHETDSPVVFKTLPSKISESVRSLIPYNSTPYDSPATNSPAVISINSEDETTDDDKVEIMKNSTLTKIEDTVPSPTTPQNETATGSAINSVAIDKSILKECLKEELSELKKSMDEKIHEMQQLVAYDVSFYHFKMSRFVWNSLSSMDNKIDTLQESVSLLLKDDPLVQRAMELQQENNELRAKLSELLDKFN